MVRKVLSTVAGGILGVGAALWGLAIITVVVSIPTGFIYLGLSSFLHSLPPLEGDFVFVLGGFTGIPCWIALLVADHKHEQNLKETLERERRKWEAERHHENWVEELNRRPTR